MAHCVRCRQVQLDRGVKEEDVVEEYYQGESSRSTFTRLKELFRDYKLAMRTAPPPDGEESKSWMADHTRASHQGVTSQDPRQDYQFTTLTTSRKPLLRQLEEAIRIKDVATTGRVARRGKQPDILVCRQHLNRELEHWVPKIMRIEDVGR